MGSILVRGLDQKTIKRLKEHARLNGRSLQQEVKALLERAADALTKRRPSMLPDMRKCGILDQRRPITKPTCDGRASG